MGSPRTSRCTRGRGRRPIEVQVARRRPAALPAAHRRGVGGAGSGGWARLTADRLAEPLAKAVGGRTATPLAEALDLHTVGDLLRHYPRRYLSPTELDRLRPPAGRRDVTLVAEVADARTPGGWRRAAARCWTSSSPTATAGCTSRSSARCPYHLKRLTPGPPGAVRRQGRRATAGSASSRTRSTSCWTTTRTSPASRPRGSWPSLPIPIYPASAKVPSAVDPARPCARCSTRSARCRTRCRTPSASGTGWSACGRRSQLVHRPTDMRGASRSPAGGCGGRRRSSCRSRWRAAGRLAAALHRDAARRAPPGGLLDGVRRALPFTLTAGQREVGGEIAADLAGTHPMHRLLQGEVGSGKTRRRAARDAHRRRRRRPGRAARPHRGARRAAPPLDHRDARRPRRRAACSAATTDGTQVALLTGSLGAAARSAALLDGGVRRGRHRRRHPRAAAGEGAVRRPRAGRRRRAAPVRRRAAGRAARQGPQRRRTCW